MKNAIKNIIALLVLGVVFFVFRVPINRAYQNIKDEWFPCRYPISYSIGTMDDRFHLSQTEFLQSIDRSAEIWNKIVGKKLFVYQTDGDLKINLKYDTRQNVTDKMSDIGSTVNDGKSTYDNLKFEYDSLKNDIDYLRSNVRSQSDVQNLNQKVDRLNQLAAELNQSAENINSKVDEYNNMGSSLGGEFEEGLYFSNKDGRGIDIYQFKNQTNLTRTLTHELGHALSLDHSNDSNAIMYYLNSNDSLTPSEDDINALKAHCGIK